MCYQVQTFRCIDSEMQKIADHDLHNVKFELRLELYLK